MLDIANIFKNRVPNIPHLLEAGFVEVEGVYTISYNILHDQFQMNILIASVGTVSVKVLDISSQEEYVLVHTPTASGAFVGSVIQACEEKLEIIAAECFSHSVFKSEQAKQLIEYVYKTHNDYLEFLWKKFSDNAVLRRKDGGKWYAAVLTVAKGKLGLEGNEVVGIIVLRGLPDEIEQLIDGKKYFMGYHMNKKHWYAICLDDSVLTREICERIEASYLLASSNKQVDKPYKNEKLSRF